MPQSDFLYFSKLKEHLVRKVQEHYPHIDSDISQWKGKEISFFQQDLEERVSGRISEKWFYTHLKSDTDKLPRIDILDLLSQYSGFADWLDFKNNNQIKQSKSLTGLWQGIIIIFIIALGLIYLLISRSGDYKVTIVDAYTNKPIDPNKITLTQYFNDQSPKVIKINEEGEYVLRPQNSEISISVNAPYYHPDTIRRKVNSFSHTETIGLFPNDYALMLHYFSNTDTEDWTQRRIQLSEIVSDNAKIFQLDKEGQMVLEMYSKHSFINKLTIPSTSLRNIEIVDIRFEGDKISQLRFIQQKGGIDE